jgi:hypothetical protein
VVKPGTRVKVSSSQYGDSIFAGRTGVTVAAPLTGWAWEVWVQLDIPMVGNSVFGFLERELEEIPADSTGSAG